MTLLNIDEFHNILNNSNEIENRIINFQTIDLKQLKSIKFKSCNIIGNLKIYNSSISPSLTNRDKSISFIDCNFNNCNLRNCDLGELVIQNSSFTSDFSISNSTILSFEINNCNDITSKFNFSLSKFKESFLFSDNTFKETGKMFIFNNEFNGDTFFVNNSLNNLNFLGNTFSNVTEFTNNILNDVNKFQSCYFKELEFSNL